MKETRVHYVKLSQQRGNWIGRLLIGWLVLISCSGATERSGDTELTRGDDLPIVTGADQVDRYVPYLKGKRVGMVVNQTSIIGDKLSVDSLLALGKIGGASCRGR